MTDPKDDMTDPKEEEKKSSSSTEELHAKLQGFKNDLSDEDI